MTANESVSIRLARLEDRLVAVQHDLEETRAEFNVKIDGPPWERSVRGRIHQLENAAAASRNAQLAAEAVTRAINELKEERSQRWTRGQKIAIGFASLTLAMLQIVSTSIIIIASTQGG